MRATGQAVGAETTARTDWNAWLRISGLVILASGITAVIVARSLEASQLHRRLSVPPLYDDVSCFLDAVRSMNAVDDAFAVSVWASIGKPLAQSKWPGTSPAMMQEFGSDRWRLL
jgi:hypothetical protein